MAKTISILNKKGYYTDFCSKAKIFSTYFKGAIIQNLLKEKLLILNKNTKESIRNIVNTNEFESTLIIFKEEYNFDSLPKGYKLVGTDLIYNLKVLKEKDDIKIKSLVELDHELTESIKNLEDWVKKLPKRID